MGAATSRSRACASSTTAGRAARVRVRGERRPADVEARAEVDDFVFGVRIFTADGVSVYGNTHLGTGCRGGPRAGASLARLSDLRASSRAPYLLDVAVHRRDGTYDYHRGLHSFRVKSRIKDVGVYRPPHRWSFTGGLELEKPAPRPELDLHEGK